MDPDTVVLRRPEEIAAVTSPARQEIIGALNETPRTAAELAERLGRSVHSLHYHLRILERAGVVRREEPEEPGGGARFAPTARRIAVGTHPEDPAAVRGAVQAARAVLSITEREILAAIRSGDARRRGEAREVVALRGKARLGRDDLRRLNELVDELEALLRASHREASDARMYALTVVLTPARETPADEGEP